MALRCDKCGSSSSSVGGIDSVPPEMRRYVTGSVVITHRTIGICGECYGGRSCKERKFELSGQTLQKKASGFRR